MNGSAAPSTLVQTDLWQDAQGVPASVEETLARAEGHDELADAIASQSVKRLILSGNGASWYAANAGWLAGIHTGLELDVASVPAGILAGGAFPWRKGDLVLALSSSGQLRDLLEAVEQPGFPRPLALLTASSDSPLAREADVVALVSVHRQRSLTHTQAYLGLLSVIFDLIGRLNGDSGWRRSLREAPALLDEQLAHAAAWAAEQAGALEDAPRRSAVSFGSGVSWAAAQEAALLLKEIAALPSEGSESREGATTSMYALDARDLALALPTPGDRFVEEAASVCGSRGAHVLSAPWPAGGDPRFAPLMHFLAPLAFAIELAITQKLNPDQPPWHAAYEATVRRSEIGTT